MVVVVIQRVDVNVKIRIYIIVLIVVVTIIHQISTETRSIKLSGLRLLILHLYPVELLSCPLLLPLCRFFRHTMIVFFSFRLLSHLSQLIVPCMSLLQVPLHFLLPLIM